MSGPDVQLVREARPWWNDYAELANFGRWLIDTARLRDPWELVEKPWNWGSEHEEFLREDALERLADEAEAHGDQRYAL